MRESKLTFVLRFNDMKKIILPIFFLFLSSVSQAGPTTEKQTLKMSTVLKPPMNTVSRLQLIPQPNHTAKCNAGQLMEGTVYIDATNNLVVCKQRTPTSLSSAWALDNTTNIIYLQDWTNPNIKVGIGANSPTYKLEIARPTTNTPGSNNCFEVDAYDPLQKLGMRLKTRGVPTFPLNNAAAFINFEVGTTGRIIYTDRRDAALTPWFPSGIGIQSITSDITIDMWMDAGNGNVGIGVGADPATRVLDLARQPSTQLEVKNGNLKARNVYLTDGVNTAELKTTYIAGGYYAVLAP